MGFPAPTTSGVSNIPGKSGCRAWVSTTTRHGPTRPRSAASCRPIRSVMAAGSTGTTTSVAIRSMRPIRAGWIRNSASLELSITAVSPRSSVTSSLRPCETAVSPGGSVISSSRPCEQAIPQPCQTHRLRVSAGRWQKLVEMLRRKYWRTGLEIVDVLHAPMEPKILTRKSGRTQLVLAGSLIIARRTERALKGPLVWVSRATTDRLPTLPP